MASLEEQIAASERRTARLKERNRKRETRIKILKGAAFDRLPEHQQRALLDDTITAERDRKLLGLPPRQQQEPEPDPEPEPEPKSDPAQEPEYEYDPNDPFGGI